MLLSGAYYCVTYYYATVSTASWARAWDFLTHGHDVRKVGGSNPVRGTIIGGVFPSSQATGKIFSAEYAIYCIL